jgi:hypothetical protein
MKKIIHRGATFSVNMTMIGNKGVLSIPIYPYIDTIIHPTKLTINQWNEMQVEFTISPGSPEAEKRYTIIENGDERSTENSSSVDELK